MSSKDEIKKLIEKIENNKELIYTLDLLKPLFNTEDIHSKLKLINNTLNESTEDYENPLEKHNGKILIRIPKMLHKSLKMQATIEGVSLNQYILYKLSR